MPAGATRARHDGGGSRVVLIRRFPGPILTFHSFKRPLQLNIDIHRRLRVISKTCVDHAGTAPAGLGVTSHTKVGTKNTLFKAVVGERGSESYLPRHPVGYMGLSDYKVLPPPA